MFVRYATLRLCTVTMLPSESFIIRHPRTGVSFSIRTAVPRSLTASLLHRSLCSWLLLSLATHGRSPQQSSLRYYSGDLDAKSRR